MLSIEVLCGTQLHKVCTMHNTICRTKHPSASLTLKFIPEHKMATHVAEGSILNMHHSQVKWYTILLYR